VGEKEALCGCRFTSNKEVKGAVHTWLREQPISFFSAGIQKLVERYNKCIVLQGDYVEKLYVKCLQLLLLKLLNVFCLYFFILPHILFSAFCILALKQVTYI
jgi:hypothetical protein